MASVVRLLPRHWDGRRLLQFLTGLALIALAFAVPAALDPADQPVEAPVTIITTVDTPLTPGLPVLDAPDQASTTSNQTGLALEVESTEAAGSAESADSAGGDARDTAPVDRSAVQGPAGLPVQGRPGGRICVEARATVGDSGGRAHSERGPPRA